MVSPQITEVKGNKIAGFDKWEIENAADTLSHAEEIKNKPKLCKAALGLLKQKATATQEAVMNVGQAMNHAGKSSKKQAASQKKAKRIFG